MIKKHQVQAIERMYLTLAVSNTSLCLDIKRIENQSQHNFKKSETDFPDDKDDKLRLARELTTITTKWRRLQRR
jgi:hypothetical protein